MEDLLETTPEELYLDLIKKTLAFALWPEPPVPIDPAQHTAALHKRIPVALLARLLAHHSIMLCRRPGAASGDAGAGASPPAYAHTMIGATRLDNLQYCVETVLKENIKGDLIEAGAWRGGACVFMRGILAAHGIEDRKVYVADSFEGPPPPDRETCPADEIAAYYSRLPFLAVSQADVAENFRKYGLLDGQVVFLKGWFSDTLPAAAIDRISILRVDAYMYSSTLEALTILYPKLSTGGFCIVDDYNATSKCRAAVDDYRANNGIDAPIQVIDRQGIFWRRM